MPRVKQFNEEDVLLKAMELFWKKGYYATSIQDLVDFLGINRASLYDTFGGKKALFEKSFATYRLTNINGMQSFLNNQNNVKIGFEKMFEIGIKESICDKDRKGCFVVNTTTELIPTDDTILFQLKDNQTKYEKIFYDFLLTGVKRGEISKNKDLKSIASLIYTLFGGLKVIGKIESDEKKLKATIAIALTVLD